MLTIAVSFNHKYRVSYLSSFSVIPIRLSSQHQTTINIDMPNWRKSRRSKGDPPGGLANEQPDSGLQLEQSSGEPKSQQASLSPPIMSRSGRIIDKFRRRSKSPSPSPNTTGQPIAISAPPSTRQVQTLTKTDVHAVILPLAKSNLVPNLIEPSPHSSAAWDKALEIAKEKLGDKLPLDLTNLTLQSAEENMEVVIKALHTLQEDDKKKRWSYTWRGKKVMIVEQAGKIFKSIDKYSKIVGTAVQSNPQISALVWAGVLAIMRVRI